MLEYLSSELDSSEDSEVVRKRRSQQIDHVFCEITKVTQSAVDRYVDGILLNTIYKKAGVEAGKGGYTNNSIILKWLNVKFPPILYFFRFLIDIHNSYSSVHITSPKRPKFMLNHSFSKF